MPFNWKVDIVQRIIEGFIILLGLMVLGYLGLAFYFSASVTMPSDIIDFAKLVFACWVVSTLAGFIRGKVDWPK